MTRELCTLSKGGNERDRETGRENFAERMYRVHPRTSLTQVKRHTERERERESFCFWRGPVISTRVWCTRRASRIVGRTICCYNYREFMRRTLIAHLLSRVGSLWSRMQGNSTCVIIVKRLGKIEGMEVSFL